MIYYSIPYSTEKKLGKYYNDFMKLLGDDDVAVFLDGDATFLTSTFGHQIEKYLEIYPECGIFTSKTTRNGNKQQLAGNWNSDNIKEHREVAKSMMGDYSITRLDNSNGENLSGTLIVLRKKIWEKLGGFSESGILGVDTNFSIKASNQHEPIYIMNGILVYHWYRGGDRNFKEHLI